MSDHLYFSASAATVDVTDISIFGPHGPKLASFQPIKGNRWLFEPACQLAKRMFDDVQYAGTEDRVIARIHRAWASQVGTPSPAPASRIFRVGTAYVEKFPAPARRYRDVSQFGLDLGVLVMGFGNDGWSGRVHVSDNGSPLGKRLASAVGTVGGDVDAFDDAAEKLHAAWQKELAT